MAPGERLMLSIDQNLVFPEARWKWYVFGREKNPDLALMIVTLTFDPPLWRRILTRIFLGSVWERIK